LSTASRRVRTLRTLVAGSPIAGSPHFQAILRELAAIANAQRVQGRRKQLLGVLHTTRALDTSLREFLVQKAIPLNGATGLGGYLIRLANHQTAAVGRLPQNRRAHFQRAIADVRNRYMHEADCYPASQDANRTLAEMDDCLVETLAL
jgi:hypothetical protein